jgi:hypothetical protein
MKMKKKCRCVITTSNKRKRGQLTLECLDGLHWAFFFDHRLFRVSREVRFIFRPSLVSKLDRFWDELNAAAAKLESKPKSKPKTKAKSKAKPGKSRKVVLGDGCEAAIVSCST